MKYRVIEDYRSPYPEPLVFLRGDRVRIGQEFRGDSEWMGWIWCEGLSGVKAWTPKGYLVINGKEGEFTKDYNAR